MTVTLPILVVDIDDVIATMTLGVISYASGLLRRSLRSGDIKCVGYWLGYGVTDYGAFALVPGYNDAGFPCLVPVDGLAKLFMIHAVTARDIRVRQATIGWLDKHLIAKITDVHFLGNRFASDNVLSKSEICHQSCNYPWSNYDRMHLGVVSCKDWRGVCD